MSSIGSSTAVPVLPQGAHLSPTPSLAANASSPSATLKADEAAANAAAQAKAQAATKLTEAQQTDDAQALAAAQRAATAASAASAHAAAKVSSDRLDIRV